MRDVQKKTDGIQIAIVRVMWLLLLLSGKFWQQTAVSRIPLHAGLVEIQSQKWADASHVWWIQLWNSLRNNACVWNSASNWGKTLVETFELLKQAYGEECMSCTQCYEWFKCFKEGRTSVSEDPRLGWTSTSKDDFHESPQKLSRYGGRPGLGFSLTVVLPSLKHLNHS